MARDDQPIFGLRGRAKALVLMLAALSLMALIVRDLYARRHGEAAYANAQAIAGDYAHSRVLDDRDAEDDQLRADELDAGAIWAQGAGCGISGSLGRR